MAEQIVNIASQHIESKIKQGSKAIVKVKSEANALLSELKNVNKLVVDAEGNAELRTSPEVRGWVEKAGKIAYEAEDEVDTLLLSKSSLLSVFYLGLWAHPASKKLRILKERTREVKSNLDELAQGSNKEGASHALDSRAPEGHLPVAGDFVIGIDHEITKVVDLLTGKSGIKNRLAIIGMGGAGKTTLVRSIYNLKAVKKHFHFQAWVSVSRIWDTSTVLIDVLKQIPGGKRYFTQPGNDEGQLEHEPNKLVSLLNKIVHKKSCLLVLDDVWDLQSLHTFIGLIQGDDPNSRTYTIVITSRQNPLNHINWCIHHVQRLTDEDSLKLLGKIASNSSKAISVEYRNLAMALLRKCQGLPLAIVALGKQLKTKDSMGEWEKVLSQIESEEGTSIYNPVKEILGLSYDELPYYLKPCFLYLGIFSEGTTISGGTLIRMWIAEGFVEPEQVSDGKETLEVAGRRYLKELIDHTMIYVVDNTYSGKVKTVQLHNIMRDFCMLKARELDFLAVSSSGSEDITGKTFRRAAINSKTPIPSASNSHLRSLALYGQSSTSAIPENYRSTSQGDQRCVKFDHVYQTYKLLRVLDIFGIKSQDGTLPREIGNLIHLTYLRIRSTNVRQLPKSIGKLCNLLTLDYRDISNDTEVQVPNVLWKLERLRHLYLPNEMSGSVEALKLDTLKDLITLWGIGGGNWILTEMGKLSTALSKLFIHRISTEDQLKVVLGCTVITENGCVYALALDWYGFEFKNLDALLAKQSLQKLKLKGKAPDKSYIQGLKFPPNLGKLELYYTQFVRVETMVCLGQLVFLKVLNLSKDSYMGTEWSCDKEAFPILEELKLANLPKLEQWEIEEGAMPCLKKLSIVSCINLKRMPEGLKLVQSLENLEIERMPFEFISRILKAKCKKEKGGEDFHIIKHIPNFIVRDTCSTPYL